MLKSLLAAMLLLGTASAFAAAPTVYGLINKEYRWVNQDDNANTATETGVTDVDGFESRMGVKGSWMPKEGLTVAAKIELGINSQRDDGGLSGSTYTDERIRIRLAHAMISGRFGALTVGQAWIPHTLRMLKLDPLTATGAQLLGLESAGFVGNVAGNWGVQANYFQDLLTYQTPVFEGVQLHLTRHQSTSRVDKSQAVSRYNTATLTYDKSFGDITLAPHFTYGKEDKTNTLADADNKYWTGALRAHWKSLMFSFTMSEEHVGRNTLNTKDVETDHMTVAASYAFCENLSIAANYGTSDFGENGTNTGEQTQWAVGPIYAFDKNFKTRLIYKNMERESKTAITGLANNDKKSEATAIIAGLTVGF